MQKGVWQETSRPSAHASSFLLRGHPEGSFQKDTACSSHPPSKQKQGHSHNSTSAFIYSFIHSREGLTMLLRLASNSWIQAILPLQLPKYWDYSMPHCTCPLQAFLRQYPLESGPVHISICRAITLLTAAVSPRGSLIKSLFC